jgi:hypothetical protein
MTINVIKRSSLLLLTPRPFALSRRLLRQPPTSNRTMATMLCRFLDAEGAGPFVGHATATDAAGVPTEAQLLATQARLGLSSHPHAARAVSLGVCASSRGGRERVTRGARSTTGHLRGPGARRRDQGCRYKALDGAPLHNFCAGGKCEWRKMMARPWCRQVAGATGAQDHHVHRPELRQARRRVRCVPIV